MLEELHVTNLALIEDVWIGFDSGMTVLTGETGTGKTALVGALKLLVGERADSTMVRSGSAEAVVEGRFVVGGSEMVAQRRVTADGRSRCVLDGEMVTVTVLGERLGPIVDLHGQHEHQSLLSPSSHAHYLDRSIGEPALEALEEYRSARAEHDEAAAELDHAETALADAMQHAEHLRFVIGEIEALDPRPGEDEELELRLPALTHAERLLEAAWALCDALRGEGGAGEVLASAIVSLERSKGLDPTLDSLSERAEALFAEIDDLGTEARSYAESVEHDPQTLDEVHARLASLSGLKKKYGPALDGVLATLGDARRRSAAIETGDVIVRNGQKRLNAARERLRLAASRLSETRREAVGAFTDSLATAASELNMAGARFDVVFTELPFSSWGLSGSERVEFCFSPAEGEPARPLTKIVSGGELSRVMLALKSVLGDADDVPVLVFDEVDAGIGGVTGLTVGERLASLASGHQVLVVTHLAQVAAFADRHLAVGRREVDGRTVTVVEAVEGPNRVAEIARMLSGRDSEASLTHAQELLAQVRKAAGRVGA